MTTNWKQVRAAEEAERQRKMAALKARREAGERVHRQPASADLLQSFKPAVNSLRPQPTGDRTIDDFADIEEAAKDRMPWLDTREDLRGFYDDDKS